MTKKHFQALADAVKTQREWAKSVQEKRPFDYADALSLLNGIMHELADVCTENNPRFDRARFLKACGVEEQP